MKAIDVMTCRVVELMERERIKRLPVVRGRRLVGIVSRANLLHAVASLSPITVIAENVRGVKDVRDHLVWAGPNSGIAA